MTAIVLAAVVAILVIGLVVTMIRGARAKPSVSQPHASNRKQSNS